MPHSKTPKSRTFGYLLVVLTALLGACREPEQRRRGVLREADERGSTHRLLALLQGGRRRVHRPEAHDRVGLTDREGDEHRRDAVAEGAP